MSKVETKTIMMDIKAEEDGEFWGVASTDVIDSDYDIVETSAFTKTLSESKVRAIFYMHDVYRPPVGGAKDIYADKNKLKFRGVINLNSSDGKSIWWSIKEGFVDRVSIGFRTLKSIYKRIDGKDIRVIQELALKEISVIPKMMAANEQALIEGFKSDGVLDTIKSNLHDQELKRKIFSLYGVEPGTTLDGEPGITTQQVEPGFFQDLLIKIGGTNEY